MTLISMLIALIIERLAVRSSPWQFVSYIRPYLKLSAQGPLAGLASHQIGIIFWWLLPAILVQWLLFTLDFWLLDLVLNTLVLLVCIGSWHYRKLYKQYLNAASRQDDEAAWLSLQQISFDQGLPVNELSHGQRLVWVNFKYYAAVLFWYALLGVFGAVAYACLRHMAEQVTYQDVAAEPVAAEDDTESKADEESAAAPVDEQTAETVIIDAQEMALDIGPAVTIEHEENSDKAASDPAPVSELSDIQLQWQAFAQDLSFWADWLPIRLFGLGMALVGHFSKASGKLLSYLTDNQTPGWQVYSDLARAAEPLPEEMLNCSDESCTLVQLAKRNILFFLALVAILTLSGLLS